MMMLKTQNKQNMRKSRGNILTLCAALMLACVFAPQSAHAQCADPVGVVGEIVMLEPPHNVPAYCDDNDNWIAMNGGNGNGSYIPNAVVFDGSTSLYEVLGSGTGVTPGTMATGSLWFKSSDVTSGPLFASLTSGFNAGFSVSFTTNFTLRIRGYNPGGSSVMLIRTNLGI